MPSLKSYGLRVRARGRTTLFHWQLPPRKISIHDYFPSDNIPHKTWNCPGKIVWGKLSGGNCQGEIVGVEMSKLELSGWELERCCPWVGKCPGESIIHFPVYLFGIFIRNVFPSKAHKLCHLKKTRYVAN